MIRIVPLLLVCFGDVSTSVRSAAEQASRGIMGQLSSQGGQTLGWILELVGGSVSFCALKSKN